MWLPGLINFQFQTIGINNMCEDKSSDFFHCPAYKLMISDIKCAVQRTSSCDPNHSDVGEGVGQELDDWLLVIHKLPVKIGQSAAPRSEILLEPPLELQLKLVWIQGTVTRIEKTEDENFSLVISDDGDEKEEAIIYEYNTVPGGDHPDIKIGSYVGTLGQVWSNDPVTVKATKVMYLGDNPLCRTIWKDDVTLAKAFLAGLILPAT